MPVLAFKEPCRALGRVLVLIVALCAHAGCDTGRGVGQVAQSASTPALTCLVCGVCRACLVAGRDQHVFATDLKTMESSCLFRTRDPVLKLVLAPDKGLWVSMTNSDIELFHVDAVLQVQLTV